MKLIDLHVHTTKSDGTLTPAETVSLAREKGLAAIAVTDHDTVGGIAEAQAAGAAAGVEVVPGMEVSTGWEHTEIHLLGYLFDPASPALGEAIDWVINDRRERNEKMAALMRADGIPVTAEEMYRRYPQSTVGRPHFAVKLMEQGMAVSVKDAFARYLAPGQKYYVRRNHIAFDRAVELICQAGGRAVLAHPFQYRYDDERLRRLLDYCRETGVSGVECLYSGYTPEQEEYLEALAGEYGFLITGGSDFHGSHKPEIELGRGIGGTLAVPYELLEKLKNK
jgi:predicted metal-dependent phosphoesterase TrpH